ncbi:MAG: glycosyltransferase family 4 protein [Bacteroidetes bacterium]|nr:glycosyltransferase family 4 protein [Bacteroidota bacterium]
MKIAVNTRLLIKDKLEGIGWFTFETFKRITKNHPEHEFIFIFDRPFSDEFIFSSNVKPVVIYPQSRHPFLWYVWFEHSLSRFLKKTKPDLFVSPDGFLSLSSNIPSFSVIHDINFVHQPKDLPFLARKYYNHYFPLYAKKSKRIATVSEFSKKDLCENYQINNDKVDVVYNGVNKTYSSVSECDKKAIKNKYTKGKDFFVFVGALHPRKNVSRLLLAFDEFKKKSKSDIKLVIVGGFMFKNNSLKNVYSNLFYKDDIIFTGRLSPDDLRYVLGSALALTFVPYFEGFGIPIIEAMSCGTPVITSNVTSMPEVAGDAALLVDPFSVEEIKNAMLKIVKDNNLRNELIKKGFVQQEKFSWDKTAEKLWASIESCFE